MAEKKSAHLGGVKRSWIELGHPQLSIRRQCELLGLNRSTWRYRPAQASDEDLRLMRLIDEQYLRRPFFGSRRMTLWLCSVLATTSCASLGVDPGGWGRSAGAGGGLCPRSRDWHAALAELGQSGPEKAGRRTVA